MRLSAAVALLLAVVQVHAATVEVRVLDDEGGVLPGRSVELQPVLPGQSAASLPFRGPSRERTGEGGIARFAKLKPGSYRVALAPGSKELVDPKVVTLTADEDAVTVELVLRRGQPVVARMVSAQASSRRGALSLQGERTGTRLRVNLTEGMYADLPLVPDRWHAHLSPPMGFTVVRSELGGESWQDGVFELKPDAPTTFLEWEIAAPSALQGKIVSNVEPNFELQIELLMAGVWAQARESEGREVARHLTAFSDRHGDFGLLLPDGIWRVRPILETRCTAKPPSLDVEVLAGGSARGDFEIDCQASEEGREQNLHVLVEAPEGTPLRGAEIHVLRAGTKEEVAHHPLSLDTWAPSFSFTLDAGSYTVEASYPGFLPGALEVADLTADERRRVSVRLREGGRIRVRATEAKETPLEGVRVSLGPRSGEDDRVQTTDASGWVTFLGLEAGEYRLDAEPGVGPSRRRVAWEGGEPVVVLADGGKEDRRLRVLPAAAVTGRLACEDGQAVPEQTWIRLLPGTTDVSEPAAVAEALENPVLARLVTLQRDGAFEAGPLDPGSVRVLFHPAGFDRVTWALGTEAPRESAVVQVTDTEPVDLGKIQVHCGPRALVRLDAKAPPVDLRLGPLQVHGVLLEGFDPVTRHALGRTPTKPLTTRRSPDAIEIENLPEGTVELTVELCSPAAPAPAEGEPSCVPAEGKRARPLTWTVLVPAVFGKVSRAEVAWVPP